MLFDYNRWANRRVLDAAAKVPEDAYFFAAAPGLSFGNLHATLVHILVAEVVWLARWQGGVPPEALKDARIAGEIAGHTIPTFEAVKALWREEETKQDVYLAGITDADIVREVSYRNQYGEANDEPLDQLMAHLINHGTQFRAEAAVRLTQLGCSPGDLDLIVYLRRL